MKVGKCKYEGEIDLIVEIICNFNLFPVPDDSIKLVTNHQETHQGY